MQIRSNSENSPAVIRNVKIKDQLGAVFLFFECFHLWMHFSRNVNFALMSAFTWNEWTYVLGIFVVLNSVDILKKKKKNENVSKFWTMGISKWLVIIVSSQPVLINTSFHCEIVWIKMWYPEGHDFEKSNEPFDHAYSDNWP